MDLLRLLAGGIPNREEGADMENADSNIDAMDVENEDVAQPNEYNDDDAHA